MKIYDYLLIHEPETILRKCRYAIKNMSLVKKFNLL